MGIETSLEMGEAEMPERNETDPAIQPATGVSMFLWDRDGGKIAD
jgi:hypothetical protein